MSVLRPLLNTYLRLTEKPLLKNATGPEVLRRSLETKARLLFHAPLSMRRERVDLAGSEAVQVSPRKGPEPQTTILYFHGGGFVFGSPATHAAMVAALAKRAAARAVLPRYPLAPEHPFPAALTHAMAAYRASRGQSDRVVIGGDSAGGGLALALLAQLLASGEPTPDAVFAFSPLTDMTFSGASFRENAEADVILPAERAQDMAQMYLNGEDPASPLVSPLFADFTDGPPVWITAGDTEILVDDSRRIVDRMKAQGVDITYKEEVDLPHVWPLFHNIMPEARLTLNNLAAWIGD
jgi:acetyl esterase/lipase